MDPVVFARDAIQLTIVGDHLVVSGHEPLRCVRSGACPSPVPVAIASLIPIVLWRASVTLGPMTCARLALVAPDEVVCYMNRTVLAGAFVVGLSTAYRGSASSPFVVTVQCLPGEFEHAGVCVDCPPGYYSSTNVRAMADLDTVTLAHATFPVRYGRHSYDTRLAGGERYGAGAFCVTNRIASPLSGFGYARVSTLHMATVVGFNASGCCGRRHG